jgi:hypothetical protein
LTAWVCITGHNQCACKNHSNNTHNQPTFHNSQTVSQNPNHPAVTVMGTTE